MTALSFFTTHPDGTKTETALTDGMRVGRGHDCELRYANAFLSTVHFLVHQEGDTFVLESNHQHSSSTKGILGTYVNDEKVIGRRPLNAGDLVSPVGKPQPHHPVFLVGPTVSPTPMPVKSDEKPWWKFW